MSKYVSQISFSEDFEGDNIKAIMRPLEFADALMLEGIEIAPEGDSPEAIKAAKAKQSIELAKAIAPLLPKYIVLFEGLKDSEGRSVSIDEVCKSAYFARLINSMGMALAASGYPENPKLPAARSAS